MYLQWYYIHGAQNNFVFNNVNEFFHASDWQYIEHLLSRIKISSPVVPQAIIFLIPPTYLGYL